ATSIVLRSAFATAPAATEAAVCRALACSSASRTSPSPYFRTPARSAWPGRGSVTGFVPLPEGSPSGGHGLIPQVQFRWSRLRTTSASGVPSVRPWRSPASTSTSSVSICWRGLRPYPCWRRRRSLSIAAFSSRSPAGRPVTTTSSAIGESLRTERRTHHVERSGHPRPGFERRRALADEDLRPVDNGATPGCARRLDQCGRRPVGVVGKVDDRLLGSRLEQELVLDGGRVDDEVTGVDPRRPVCSPAERDDGNPPSLEGRDPRQGRAPCA